MSKQPDLQFSLPGFDPPERQNSDDKNPDKKKSGDNFFFALQPDKAAGDASLRLAQRLCDEYGLRGRPFMPTRQHISLLGLGRTDSLLGLGRTDVAMPKLLAFADKIASLILASPFEVILDRVLNFSGKSQIERSHPIVLVGNGSGVAGIESLLRAQLEAVNALGIPTKKHKFSPHMTLLYDWKSIPEQVVAPIQWTAKEFVLIQSHVGQNRPYTVLDRWSLTGKAQVTH